MKAIDLSAQAVDADPSQGVEQSDKMQGEASTTEAEPTSCTPGDSEARPGQQPLTVRPTAIAAPWSTITIGSKKGLRSQYKRSLDEILEYFSADEPTSADVVHDLRVNLKRMQALTEVLRFVHKKVSNHTLKALRTLYSKAGALRSAQIEFELISHHYGPTESSASYLGQLHVNKKHILEDYRKYVKKGPSRQIVQGIKTLKKLAGTLSRKDVRGYFDAAQKRVAHRLRRSIFREQELHLIRKDLKQYYLNLRLADNENTALKEFLELLGAWHDRQSAFDHLMKARYTGRFTAFEREPIEKIKQSILLEKGQLYDQIASFYTQVLMPGQRKNKMHHEKNPLPHRLLRSLQ